MNVRSNGAGCHAVRYRLSSTPDPHWLEHVLLTAMKQWRGPASEPADLAMLRFRAEQVPGTADSPTAQRHRAAELRWPLLSAHEPLLRCVLLCYPDGLADLLLVAARDVLDYRSLHVVGASMAGVPALAQRVATTGSLPLDAAAEEARLAELLAAEYVRPSWGRGDPAAGHEAGEFQQPLGVPDATTALAAVALVIARYDGLDRAVLGAITQMPGRPEGLGPFDGRTLLALSLADHSPVADLLQAAEERLSRPGPWHTDEVATALAQADGGGVVSAGVLFDIDAYDVTGARAAYIPCLTPVFPLTIAISRAAADELRATCLFDRRWFGEGMVAQFARHVAHAGRQLASVPPSTPLAEIEFFDRHERSQIIALGVPPQALTAVPGRIDEVVSIRAAERADAIAVTGEGIDLTYRQLDERANQLAHALRASGVAERDRVGVCMERSPELVVTLLAVLRAGAVYVPMDPAHPPDRLSYTASDAGVALVVCSLPDFPAGDVRVVRPDELAAIADRQPCAPPASTCSAADPAYVIYTSGSTGRPKGVVVAHRSVMGLVAGTGEEFRFRPWDVWAFFHSVAFDMSVWEIWGCLVTGGRLVVVPQLVTRSPGELHELLSAEQVTVLNQTPSAFAQLMEVDSVAAQPLGLRLVTFGGEPLDARMLLPWFDRHPESECRMVNLYGITETTVHSTWQTLTRRHAIDGSRSVGKALPGEHIYVMDHQGRLLPPGVAGEICVGGVGVALGYLNRPELTEARFGPDPCQGGRLYRSGDKGRLLPDGQLEHLGRLDDQIKLRGYRIELNEIRSVLLEDTHVFAAEVVFNQSDPSDPATARLDAYVVLHDGDAAGVRRRAARLLPTYMVPSTVTALPALPLTANGKLDRKRLPAPEISGKGGSELPSSAAAGMAETVQETVHDVWRSVLGSSVGLDDNLFDVGGNSLLVTRMVNQLVERGLPRPTLPQLYLNPTVRQLSALLEGLG
jgi:amino acid adenylation domain-containing protein